MAQHEGQVVQPEPLDEIRVGDEAGVVTAEAIDGQTWVGVLVDAEERLELEVPGAGSHPLEVEEAGEPPVRRDDVAEVGVAMDDPAIGICKRIDGAQLAKPLRQPLHEGGIAVGRRLGALDQAKGAVDGQRVDVLAHDLVGGSGVGAFGDGGRHVDRWRPLVQRAPRVGDIFEEALPVPRRHGRPGVAGQLARHPTRQCPGQAVAGSDVEQLGVRNRFGQRREDLRLASKAGRVAAPTDSDDGVADAPRVVRVAVESERVARHEARVVRHDGEALVGIHTSSSRHGTPTATEFPRGWPCLERQDEA